MQRLIIVISAVFLGVSGAGLQCGCDVGGPERAKPQAVVSVPHEEIEAALAAAGDYYDAGDDVKAEAILVRLIDKAPREIQARELYAHVLLGRAGDAHRQGEVTAAQQIFARAYEQYCAILDVQPTSAGYHLSAGEVAQMAGLDDEAMGHYTRAMELNPDDPKPPFLLAQALILGHDYEAAAHLLRASLEIDRDEPMVHASLASALAQLERYDQALEHISEARAIMPGEVVFRVIEASIHRQAGRPQRGLELLIGLAEEQRARPLVADELGRLHSDLGQHVQAANAWTLLYHHNPMHADAWLAAVRVSEALLEVGERERAWMWLQQARSAAPNAPQVQALERAFTVE